MGNGKNKPERVLPEDIYQHLQRVTASPELSGAPQLQRFLELVVGRTLQGREEELKEYTLGVEVFGRPASYDPRVDPIVRVQARRLRAKLENYYRKEGSGDKVIISMPKGGYVPVFESASTNAAGGSFRRPAVMTMAGAALLIAIVGYRLVVPSEPRTLTVAVLPLANLTGDPNKEFLADKLTEGLITELAGEPALSVKSRTTIMRYRGAGKPLDEIARELGATAVVEGAVHLDGDFVVVKARLVDGFKDTKVWAASYRRPLRDLNLLSAEIAKAISETLKERKSRQQG